MRGQNITGLIYRAVFYFLKQIRYKTSIVNVCFSSFKS